MRPSETPLTCEELSLRGLLATAGCCVLCHTRGRHGSGELVALAISTAAGDELDSEVCCTAARTLTAYQAVAS